MAACKLSTDVLVIGGGPAGLAAGLALRARGFECIVVDSRQPPIDKACGEGLMPDALHSLAVLGVTLSAEHGREFSGIRFTDGEHAVEASFPDGRGIGVRRTALHALMAEQAGKAGVCLVWNARAIPVDQHLVAVNDTLVGCRWLIGADGQGSSLRRWAALDAVSKFESRYGFRRHYRLPCWTDHVEVHWGVSGQAYVTPVGADEICVALITRDSRLRIDDVLSEFPLLEKRLRGAAMTTQERGSVTTTRKLVRVTSGSLALIGDASGSVDAVTGEGMAMSFRQAVALAGAIESGDLGAYEKAHERIGRLPGMMAGLLMLMDRFPAARRQALRTLAAAPESFCRLLSAHMGHEPLWQVALGEGMCLSRHLLLGLQTPGTVESSA